jgi:hypothetical protein
MVAWTGAYRRLALLGTMDGQEDASARDIRVEVADAVDIAVVLAPGSKIASQLDANELALLAPHGTEEFDCAVHVAGHVDRVTDGNRGFGHD